LREFRRFCNQFRGQIVAKCVVELVAFARFIRAIKRPSVETNMRLLSLNKGA